MLQELLPFAIWLIELTLVALTLGGAWRSFTRVGEPGWAVLVPIYNAVVFARAAKRREWTWFLFLPCVNLVVYAALCVELARRLGRGAAFGAGLVLLPFVFWPLLGALPRPRGPQAPVTA